MMSRGGPPPHRLPRGRPRDRRHAHRGRRPGAQGLDHPARAGARRHVLGARERPLQLPRARGATRRSRSRSAAAPPRRSCSARSSTGAESDIQQLTEIARQMVGRWGMSDGDRPGRGAPARRLGPAAPGRRRGLAATRSSVDRRGGAPHRRGGARAGRRAAAARTAASSTRSRRRCSSTRRSTRRTPTRRQASSGAPPAPPSTPPPLEPLRPDARFGAGCATRAAGVRRPSSSRSRRRRRGRRSAPRRPRARSASTRRGGEPAAAVRTGLPRRHRPSRRAGRFRGT